MPHPYIIDKILLLRPNSSLFSSGKIEITMSIGLETHSHLPLPLLPVNLRFVFSKQGLVKGNLTEKKERERAQ